MSDCIQSTPTPNPTVDPNGDTLCSNLEATIHSRQAQLHSAVPSLPLELTPDQHLSYFPTYAQRNPNLPNILRFADNNQAIVACTYKSSGYDVVRFASANPELQLLNYAAYYSVGEPNFPEDWCYTQDNFVEKPDPERNDPTVYKAGYNVPPLYRNCKGPSGSFVDPCGTLIASVYRAMDYYNTEYFYTKYSNPTITLIPGYSGHPSPWPTDLTSKYFSAALPWLNSIADGRAPLNPIFRRIYDRTSIEFLDSNGNTFTDPSNANTWGGVNFYPLESARDGYKSIKPGDLAITVNNKNIGNSNDPTILDYYTHVALVVGWGPIDPKQFTGYNLYSRYANAPANYVPYVIDRGLMFTGQPQSTYQARGPRPYWCPQCGTVGYQATGYEIWRGR